MQAHTRGRHTKMREPIIYAYEGLKSYAIPKSVADKYLVEQEDKGSISAKDVFKDLDNLRTEAGALLKGVRARENMNQIEFAQAIGVTQANLSKMENGKRPIGKQIAKRIEQVFGINYKYFLG